MVKILYHRSYDGILLRCLSNAEAREVIKEVHDGICGAHQPGSKLKDDCIGLAILANNYCWRSAICKRCKACQIHADFMHQPPELFHSIIASWLFKAWGIDVIGPISPLSARGHQFILVITDYFSKWAKATPLAEVKTINVLSSPIIHQFDVPRRIIHDSGP